jgi:hypothetical protein
MWNKTRFVVCSFFLKINFTWSLSFDIWQNTQLFKQSPPLIINNPLSIPVNRETKSRSQWPRALRHETSPLARTLWSWVRIPLEACMSVLYAFLLCLCR